MMTLQFPLSPQPGDIYPSPILPGLPAYMWDGNRWAGRAGGTMGPVVNILDYGADPTGSRDSTAALQTAIDVAFGPANNPHGDLTKNRPLYIPRGSFPISNSLKFTNIRGGRIIGEGRLQSRISWYNPSAGRPAGTISALLHFDSVCGLELSNLDLKINDGDMVNTPPIATAVHWDSSSGPCTDNLIWNINFEGSTGARPPIYGTRGFLHITTASSYENARHLYIHTGATYAGGVFVISGPKSHSINFIGSGGNFCSPVIRIDNGGHVGAITALAGHKGTPDIEMFGASGPLTVIGTRTESPSLISTDGQVHILNSGHTVWDTAITGSSNGTTLTITSVDDTPHGFEGGCVIVGGDGVNHYPEGVVEGEQLHTTVLGQLSGTPGGPGDYLTSTAAVPGNIVNGTMRAATQFACIFDGGSVTFDGCGFTYGPWLTNIRGSAGSSVAIRDTTSTWWAPRSLLRFFAGALTEYIGPITEVARLPDPAMCKGLVVPVSNSDQPADATAYGQPVQSGGNNVVRAMSDGVVWRIA